MQVETFPNWRQTLVFILFLFLYLDGHGQLLILLIMVSFMVRWLVDISGAEEDVKANADDADMYDLRVAYFGQLAFTYQKLQTTRHVFVYTYIPVVVVVVRQSQMIC